MLSMEMVERLHGTFLWKGLGSKRPTFNGKVVIVYGKNGKAYYKTNGKETCSSLWRMPRQFKLEPKAKKRLEQLAKEKLN